MIGTGLSRTSLFLSDDINEMRNSDGLSDDDPPAARSHSRPKVLDYQPQHVDVPTDVSSSSQ